MLNAHKLTYLCTDEDYPYVYEALRTMPYELTYGLDEDDTRFLEVLVYTAVPICVFEENLVKKANALKRKTNKSDTVNLYAFHNRLELL